LTAPVDHALPCFLFYLRSIRIMYLSTPQSTRKDATISNLVITVTRFAPCYKMIRTASRLQQGMGAR